MTTATSLPHQSDRMFLTDGGIETTLIFHDGIELPAFAAFVLLDRPEGRNHLRRYFERYLEIARERGLGFVLESPTWRANTDWAERVGYGAQALARVNRDAIALMAELRAAWAGAVRPIVISGCIGPRGDGYNPDDVMTVAEATRYHRAQTEPFAAGGADLVTAITMTNVPEAAGVALAARAVGLPAVISFTVETDGRLPTGEPLGEAIRAVDAETGHAPAYYMVNCAHPEHFAGVFDGGAWTARIRGVRANASRKSHAELDASTTLDEGDPDALGRDYRALRARLANLNVLGGCCGTDHRHVAAAASACAA
jgi:S-methylmethionine-dependent homocysteine/selenocysteine methylase